MSQHVFKLSEVIVYKIAKLTDKEDKHLLRFTLFYPRAGVPKLETLKILQKKLDSRKIRVFDSMDFLKRIVFKENFDGECLLRAEVVVVDEPTKIATYLKGLFSGVLQFAIGRRIEGISNIYLGKAAEITNDALFEDEDDGGLIVVGKGEVTLQSNAMPKKITIDLASPKTYPIKELKGSNKGGRGRRTTTPFLKKGDTNGRIVLSVEDL